MQEYKPRVTDKLLDFKLHSKGAVVIDGPKWCGKTTSAKQFAKSEIAFGDADDAEQNIALAEASLSAVIEGETPRLFDEWQEVPLLWDALRYEIDRRNTVGQFILTGSSIKIPKNTKEDPRRHSGTGRSAGCRNGPDRRACPRPAPSSSVCASSWPVLPQIPTATRQRTKQTA